LQNLNTNKTTG